jgi:hypothetical protein
MRPRNRGHLGNRTFWLCLVTIVAILDLSVQTKAQAASGPGMMLPKKAKATLAAYKAAGWIPLQEPDSRFVPGTIFRAIPGQWPQWISSLESCGVPKAILKPTRNNSGAFQYSGESVYGASAVLALPGVSPGAAFSSAHSAVIQQSDAGASAIDIIKVGAWIRQNHAAFSDVCRSYLSKPNTYVAQESYRVGNGTYVLKDKKDAALSLQGLLIISPSASVKKTGETSLTLTTPVYTAVHGAVYANDLLELMTAPSRGVLNYADSDIDSALPDVQEDPGTASRGVAPMSSPANQPSRGVAPAGTAPTQSDQAQGHSYALVIGVDNYQQFPRLDTPGNDAADVAKILGSEYGFDVQQLANATRDQILLALDRYRSSLGDDDSLLVYYAGHGYNDKEMKRAYWLPVDAEKDTFSHWISATDITDRARASHARHILIVSDSCYSGDLTRGGISLETAADHDVYVLRMDLRKSRHVLSSGGDEPVSDAGCPGHSIFACVLLDSLSKPEWSRFTGQDLFNQIQVRVAGGSSQTPYYKFIPDSGHDDGDFIFTSKSAQGTTATGVKTTVTVIRTAPPPDPEKDAVHDTLIAYQDAYDLKDLDALRQVWPSLTKQQIKNIEKTFDQTTAIKVDVRQPKITINGNTAVVQGDQWERYTYQGDRRPPTVDHVTIQLSKDQQKRKWVVLAVNKQQP